MRRKGLGYHASQPPPAHFAHKFPNDKGPAETDSVFAHPAHIREETLVHLLDLSGVSDVFDIVEDLGTRAAAVRRIVLEKLPGRCTGLLDGAL
jgi:hypothetical protein